MSSDDSTRPIDVQALIDGVINECRDKPLRVAHAKVLSGYPGFQVYEVLVTRVLPLLRDPEARTIVYFLLLTPREHLLLETSEGATLPAHLPGNVMAPFAFGFPSPSSSPSPLLSPPSFAASTLLPCAETEARLFYPYTFKSLFQSIPPKNVFERNFVISMFIGKSLSQVSEVKKKKDKEKGWDTHTSQA